MCGTIGVKRGIPDRLSLIFRSLISRLIMPTFPDWNYDEPALDVSFTVADIEKNLKTLRPNKSLGADGLHPSSL